MLTSNVVLLIYRQQEREYLQEAKQLRMVSEAKIQSSTAHVQLFRSGDLLARKISSFARSILIDRTYAGGACCLAR
jgi:hypothetical protein